MEMIEKLLRSEIRGYSKNKNPQSRANAEMSKCALMHPPYERC